MFYYLYEVRNNLNGKIYVGVHKTKNMDDGYMGSGKVIKTAIEKYGIENFSKVILETFETSEAMYAREEEIVTDEFLIREDVYNLRRGGTGGFDYLIKMGLRWDNTGISLSSESKQKIKQSLKELYMSDRGDHLRKESRKRVIDNPPMDKPGAREKMSDIHRNKVLTDEQKDKISVAMKGRKKLCYPKNRKSREGFKFETTICPHCGKEGGSVAMKRWHFSNCKSK